MLHSMAGSGREGSPQASLGVLPPKALSRCRRSREVPIIPETQLPHEEGLLPPLPGALRDVGISCKEVLRQGGKQVWVEGPGTSSCKEPLDGLAPFRGARSS